MTDLVIKLSAWAACVLCATFSTRGVYYFSALFFLIVFTLQSNNTDTYFYAQEFYREVYLSERGFNYLQYFIQDIIDSREIGFELLKLAAVMILITVLFRDWHRFSLLLASQFTFLATFNNLRQGLAAVLLICAVHSLKNRNRPINLCIATALLYISIQFHLSAALAGSVLVSIFVLLGLTNSPSQVLFTAITGIAVATIFVFGFVDIPGDYANYMLATSQDISSGRTDLIIKWLVISIYFAVTTDIKILGDLGLSEQISFVARACFFVIGLVTAFLFGFPELSSRVGFYFLAFDAYYFSYLLSTRGSSWRYTMPYIGSNIASPSILSILLK